jgi:hypothetical protein
LTLRIYIVIGDIHARGTCTALQKQGLNAVLVDAPNYRTSVVHKGRIAASLDKIQITKEDVLVVQVFDSGLYMAAPEEGGLIPPVKQLDGSYHIHGDFVLLAKEMQYELFKQLLTDLDKWKDNTTVFLAPLPRYLKEGCCKAPGHMKNRNEPDFGAKLEEGLYAVRKNVKDFAFRHGYWKCSTLSTWGKVKRIQDVWENSVHLTAAGYNAVAAAVAEAVTDINRKRSALPTDAMPAAKKQKMETPRQNNSTTAGSTRSRGGGSGRGGGYNRRYTDGYQSYSTPGAGFNNRGGWRGGWPRRGFGFRRGGGY